MRYAPHVLLYCFASLWAAFNVGETAKSSGNPELLTTFAKNVATVLSPALLSELEGNRVNRSAVNLGRTVSEKQNDALAAAQTTNHAVNHQVRPEFRYTNPGYPYHYESRYHYAYPPYTEQREEFYNPPYISPVGSGSPQFYHPQAYGPPNAAPTDSGTDGNADEKSSANVAENSLATDTDAASLPEANVPVHRHFDSPHLSTFTSPYSKFSIGDFHRTRHGLIPGPFVARGYGYFGPAGFDPYVPYHHPPLFPPPQNPITTPNQSSVPNNAGTESNSSSTNQYVQRPEQPIYGSPIASSFHLQGYPSTSFNLLPYDRFNNVFNGNSTNVPYFSPPVHGFYPGYNPYLPPSKPSGSSTDATPTDASKEQNSDAENIDQKADTKKSPENIETSGSDRYELKTPFSSSGFKEQSKILGNSFYLH